MTVHFLTFSGGKPCWRKSQIRLGRQLRKLAPGCKVLEITSKNLAEHVGENDPGLSELAMVFPQGHGLWAWKPFALSAALSRIDEDDYLFYLDSGCTANASLTATSRFMEYLSHLDKHGVLAFQMGHPEDHWTKSSVIRRYSLGPIQSSSGQAMATIVGLKNNRYGRDILASWCMGVAENNFSNVKNPEMGAPQLPCFVDHRHDQSVWSCLLKSRAVYLIPDETYHAPKWSSGGASFPFWATRKCSGSSLVVGESLIGRLYLATVRKVSGRFAKSSR
jgi:hypothetical protein